MRAILDDNIVGTPLDHICSLEGEVLSIEVEVVDLYTKQTIVETIQVTAQLDPIDVPFC